MAERRRNFICNHSAGDTRSRAGVRRASIAERVSAVELRGFHRQERIKALVAARLRQARCSNAWNPIRVHFASIKPEAVRKSLRISPTNLDRQAAPHFSARIAPGAAFKTNRSASASPRATSGSASQVGVLSAANEHARVATRIALGRTLTARARWLHIELAGIASFWLRAARAARRV